MGRLATTGKARAGRTARTWSKSRRSRITTRSPQRTSPSSPTSPSRSAWPRSTPTTSTRSSTTRPRTMTAGFCRRPRLARTISCPRATTTSPTARRNQSSTSSRNSVAAPLICEYCHHYNKYYRSSVDSRSQWFKAGASAESGEGGSEGRNAPFEGLPPCLDLNATYVLSRERIIESVPIFHGAVLVLRLPERLLHHVSSPSDEEAAHDAGNSNHCCDGAHDNDHALT
mmetsp:Transcript_20843/g.67491  ORF Transcript_20843/g.67491 Transcript_20843/m.67491 type:complete len:228 (+) Transcript_20843:574-1257(+)